MSSRVWAPLQERLEQRSIAYDLPGHGASLGRVPHGGAGRAAKAVAAAIGRGVVHLVGHSLGGAVASLIALRQPDVVASLTLFAPGGFGPEIDHRLLHRYAEAKTPRQLAPLVEQFFGWNAELPEGVAEGIAEERSRPGARDALLEVFDGMVGDGRQGVVDRQALAGLPMPIKVVWGTQDRILPTRQAHRLPGTIAVHVFEGVGHMVPLEVPGETLRLVRENVAAGERTR